MFCYSNLSPTLTRLCEEADEEESWMWQSYNCSHTESNGEMRTQHFRFTPITTVDRRVHTDFQHRKLPNFHNNNATVRQYDDIPISESLVFSNRGRLVVDVPYRQEDKIWMSKSRLVCFMRLNAACLKNVPHTFNSTVETSLEQYEGNLAVDAHWCGLSLDTFL